MIDINLSESLMFVSHLVHLFIFPVGFVHSPNQSFEIQRLHQNECAVKLLTYSDE